MSWSRRYALRNVVFSVSRDAATYGSGNYGDETYGQEATDPLPNSEYILVPNPGEWPTAAGWVYAVGETGRTFTAQCRGVNGVLSLSNIDRAALVIDRASVGERVVDAFPLTIDAVNDVLSYDFTPGQLERPGIYRAAVQLVFDSGRCMSVTADDSVAFTIRGNS